MCKREKELSEKYLHKAKRSDCGEWVEGMLTRMWGQFHIINPDNENTAYPVDEDTICKCVGQGYMDYEVAYEGDIFESQVSGDILILCYGIYQAYCPMDKTYMDSVGFYAKCKGYPDMPIGDLADYALKKGNIFDNPELIEQ